MDSPTSRVRRRAGFAAVLAIALTFLGAAPASAHVEATAEGAQAGTGPVTVAFSAEAESTTAGIVSAKVQLPAGVDPSSTILAAGPTGWALTPTLDGYEVAGPDIGPGVDLEYSVTIDRLPVDAPAELPFKTLLRYSDGVEDAWIELPTADNPDPENPAPAITVAAAPPGAATSSAPATESTAPSTTATESGSPEVRDVDTEPVAAEEDGATSTGLVVALVVVAAAVLAGGIWYWRSRTSART